MANQIQQTIIQQLGGFRRLKMFVNARNFAGDTNSIQFSFSGSRKANKCRVVYNPGSDLYTFELWKIGRVNMDCVYKLEDVYCDMLVELFEKNTGLYLHF